MKKVLIRSLVLALGVALVSSAAFAKKTDSGYGSYSRTGEWSSVAGMDNPNAPVNNGGLNASAAATTVLLKAYKFDSGAACITESWVTSDITQQTGNYWHVSDFTDNWAGAGWQGTAAAGGILYTPVQGTKSMWMAALPPDPADPVDTILCGYVALPGYGNGWNQAFCSVDCLPIAGGPSTELDVAFVIKYSSEGTYDGSQLEYTTDCAGNLGWTRIAGSPTAAAVGAASGGWNGARQHTVQNPAGGYVIAGNPSVRVRVHFTADTSWSNQDGLYVGFGVALDSLTWETVPLEDFEGEALGISTANSDGDPADEWTACNTPGFGNFLALFKKAGANYEDQCLDNLSCYWAAILGSGEFYTCGTPSQPAQRIVPHKNVRNEYISNEIWSPTIPINTTTGSDFRLRYTVYRDLPLDNLIFHVWHVRTIDTAGCPGAWQDRNFVYYGDFKDWALTENLIGSKINVNTGASIQIAVGVLDMCPFWCGDIGSGTCHSPAPYIDQVKVLRIQEFGPQWDVRDLDTFNDNFAEDGTTTGTGRFDGANDIKATENPVFTPADSGIVLFLVDPKYQSGAGTLASGLLAHAPASTFIGRHKTKRQVYIYVAVWPLDNTDDPGDKVGADLSDGPGGYANRYPFVATQSIGGVLWTKILMDYTYSGTATNPGLGEFLPLGCTPGVDCTSADPVVPARFNVDLNDELFEPCDTICYFYAATSTDGTSYYSSFWGSTANINDVAANPMEVTILPAGGWKRGGDILYVDGFDGGGVQNYYDGVFQILDIADLVDRFDVRGPTSGTSNRLGGRVYDVQQQLNDCYRKIIWDNGNSAITLGDGEGDPEKTDDYDTLNQFLGNLANDGGVFILGEKAPEYLDGYAGASAVTFRGSYMPFTLINNNHRLAPSSFGVSPKVYAWPGRCYDDDFILFGGCAFLNDFDVMGATGSSQVEISYSGPSNANGAVISNINGLAHVVLAGFSLAYVRDDELPSADTESDRARFIHDTLEWMQNDIPDPTPAGPALKNGLSQNYPNPFNPQTTIAFSIKDRGAVSLKVYNVNGELVRTLANENRSAGSYTLTWDGHNDAGQPVSSGVYFYKLVTNNFSQTKKMVLLK
jgi:hypothetical protein